MNNLVAFLLIFFANHSANGLKNVSQYAIDKEPLVRIDDHMQGIWKLAEDSDFHNYFIVEKDGDSAYVLTYMNRSGNNRGLEHGRAFFSEINHVKFLNFPNWDWDHHGYVFLKINNIGQGSWDMTANLVTDTTLVNVKSNSELRALFEKNLNNPAFYGKELHFRKKFEFNSFR